MDWTATWLLSIYGALIAASSLAGGLLPKLVKFTHTRMQMVMAFVAGLILGVAVFHLLPHSLAAISGPSAAEFAVAWMMAGLILTLLLLYLFDFHEHDFSKEHDRLHDRTGTSARVLKPFTGIGIALGLGVHSLTEGLTLASTVRLDHSGEAATASLGVFLAIALHKPLDAFSIVSTMRANGVRRRITTITNIAFALLCPLAAFAAYWAAAQIGDAEMFVVGCALAFATGSFLCIALSDLLPEIHFHSHDRLRLAACLVIGIVIAYALHWVEPRSLHGGGH